jgi:signal transduction histidine kinase
MTSDDLVLGEIAAYQVVTRLEYFCLLKQLQQTAAAEERVRLARDLHGGLLQSLTGAAFQLETVYRLMQKDAQAAQQRLLEVQQLIAAEQKDLRSHIRELKPSFPNLPAIDSPLAPRLKELAERIERHWGLQVEMIVKHLETRIPRILEQEIYRLFHEALINSARHAHALTVQAEFEVEGSLVRMIIADDGRGFPFRGRYEQATLNEMNAGPATLKERIASLGGFLAIDSSDTGSRLEITLPMIEKGGGDAH